MADRSHTPKGQLARTKILRAAEPLLAARGFHGTSMRDVAEACELPLASVVYHFAQKEKLYGAVLAEIAAQLLGSMHRESSLAPTQAVEASIRALVRWSLKNPRRVRLLVRELLDNPSRVSHASSLPLAPVLTTLAASVGAMGHPQPELAVLHVVGAVSYVVIARPTVRRIVGSERDTTMMQAYEEEAIAFARRAFSSPPSASPTKKKPPKGLSHETRAADRARPARARTRRGKDDGHGSRRTADARDRRVR